MVSSFPQLLTMALAYNGEKRLHLKQCLADFVDDLQQHDVEAYLNSKFIRKYLKYNIQLLSTL
jgi:hypothetical protein